jgi:hypothetical protein
VKEHGFSPPKTNAVDLENAIARNPRALIGTIILYGKGTRMVGACRGRSYLELQGHEKVSGTNDPVFYRPVGIVESRQSLKIYSKSGKKSRGRNTPNVISKKNYQSL